MKQANKFSQRILGTAIAVAMFNLAGCGNADNPDKGSPQSYSVSGLVVDGYVADGLIYLDTNDDGIVNSWEPRAYTDKDGYFSRSKPNADGNSVDYCRADATAAEAKHCLRLAGPSANAVLRVQGGIDLFSGEPFSGSMSIRMPSDPSVDRSSQLQFPPLVISPLTSLLTYTPVIHHVDLLTGLGLQPGDEARNFLEPTADGDIDRDALFASWRIHKLVSVLQNRFGQHYGGFGEESDLPANPSFEIYRTMGLVLGEAVPAPGFTFGDDLLELLVSRSDVRVRALLAGLNQTREQREEDPIFMPVSPDLWAIASWTTTVDHLILPLTPLIDRSNSDIGGGDPLTQARGVQRLLDIVLGKIETGADGIEGLRELVDTPSSDLNALLNNLSDENSDISELVEDDFSDMARVLAKAKASMELDVFTGEDAALEIAGTKMRLTGKEDKPAKGKTSSVDAAFFFEGEPGATQGDLTMCITYLENENDREAGSDDLDNARLKGTWQVLDGLNRSTVQMRVSIAQGDFSLLVKSIGAATGKPLYRFNFEGDLRKFDPVSVNTTYPDTARVAIDQATLWLDGTSVPQSDADCAAQLN